MKKRKFNNLRFQKQVISSLQQEIYGGQDKGDVFTVTCARPVSDCTIALTVQPEVCKTLPRPLSDCTVALTVQDWCK